MSTKPLYPEYGSDAAGENTYADVIAATKREYSGMTFQCETEDAIISLDGGDTDHIYCAADVAPITLQGLSIPKGATIQGKNAGAGSNYANLRINMW